MRVLGNFKTKNSCKNTTNFNNDDCFNTYFRNMFVI